MKKFSIAAFGVCLLLVLVAASAQAQLWPYARATLNAAGTEIELVGVGGTGQFACWEGTLVGTQLGTYFRGTTTNIPADCVGLFESADMDDCTMIQNSSQVAVQNCEVAPAAPDAPTLDTVNALSPHQCSLGWTDGTPTPGDEIQVFFCEDAVDCGNAGDPTMLADTVAPGVQTYTKGDLKPNGTMYNFKVCGVNAGGTTCSLVDFCTTNTLDPPTNLALSVLSSSAIQVSWTDPAPGFDGSEYKAFFCEVGEDCGGGGNPTMEACTANPGEEMCTKDGLNSNTPYNFKVCSVADGVLDCTAHQTATTDPGGLALVPQTGLTTCYDADGFVIACPGLPPPVGGVPGAGQDGYYRAGVQWPSPRYIDGDPRCDANGVGLPGVNFLDTLTDLCFLYDPCNSGGACPEMATSDWDTQMLQSTRVCDPAVDVTCAPTCTGADGSAPGDWRVTNTNEILSQVDWSRTGDGTDPPLPAELITLITTNAGGGVLAGCWNDILWTSTTAFAGAAPNDLVLANPGQYEDAWTMDWTAVNQFGPTLLPAGKTGSSMTSLLVKDPQ